MGPKKKRRQSSKKTANIYDVARKARVSVFTVSAVINNSDQVSSILRRRVESAVRELNYRPNLLARSLAKRQSHTLGIIVPDISNPFYPLVVRGAEDMAQKKGYSILLCNSDNRQDKEEQYLELLLSKRVDGILITKTPGSFTRRQLQMLSDTKVSFVLMMRTCPGLKADAVLTDDTQGAYEAVSHIARMGNQRIALVGGPLKISNARARWQGYRKALKSHGLPLVPDLVVEGDYHFDSGYRAGLTLLTRRPDAIFVTNFPMTAGFVKAAEEMGMRCPEHFGLVSFDDVPLLDGFHPRLTTIALPKYEVGSEAAEVLLKRIQHRSGPPIIRKLAPRLIVRESCGFTLRMKRTIETGTGQLLGIPEHTTDVKLSKEAMP
jgi:LacI family transcriptional regulator, galactose operon repressor